MIRALPALLEQAPEYRANQELRHGADRMAKGMAHHARGFRQVFAETGIHPINAFLHDGTIFAPILT